MIKNSYDIHLNTGENQQLRQVGFRYHSEYLAYPVEKKGEDIWFRQR